jgi:AraC-like DNA-binding protein
MHLTLAQSIRVTLVSLLCCLVLPACQDPVEILPEPDRYEFTRDGQATVSYRGQTERLNMLAEIKSKILSPGDAGEVVSEQALLDAFANLGGDGGGLFSFSSSKQLQDKTFQPDLDDKLFENLFARMATASQAGEAGTQAANGTAGLITREDQGSTILVDENGREFTQLIEKGLMGSVFLNQIYNIYLTDARVGANVENDSLSEGQNYTAMEHHWDEAFGYLAAPVDFTSPWPETRKDELRFWSKYSNTVDNVQDGLLTTNKALMDAFIKGRTAIVNKDYEGKDEQRTAIYNRLELVTAATCVHYINSTLNHLNAGNTGEVFHALSEAWAFANALRYHPNRRLFLEEIETIMETDFGANGNFWNVTPEGLNQAKTTIVGAFSELEPVKDVL